MPERTVAPSARPHMPRLGLRQPDHHGDANACLVGIAVVHPTAKHRPKGHPMYDKNDRIRCDREASDGTPGAPEIRCPRTTTVDQMDGWLVRNYGDFRKTYCPDCAWFHPEDAEPRCEWPGCNIHYRPFPAGYAPEGCDLIDSGWTVGYVSSDLTCCPVHAQQGDARNREMRLVRNRYSSRLEQLLVDAADRDPEVRAVIAEIGRLGISDVKVSLVVRTDAILLGAS